MNKADIQKHITGIVSEITNSPEYIKYLEKENEELQNQLTEKDKKGYSLSKKYGKLAVLAENKIDELTTENKQLFSTIQGEEKLKAKVDELSELISKITNADKPLDKIKIKYGLIQISKVEGIIKEQVEYGNEVDYTEVDLIDRKELLNKLRKVSK